MGINQFIQSAVFAPFLRRQQSRAVNDLIDQSIGNDYDYTFRDSTDANDVPVLKFDKDNQPLLGATMVRRGYQPITFHVYPNASWTGSIPFFCNPTQHQLAISSVMEIHTTASSVTGANITVTHETQVSGKMQAAGKGVNVLTGTFNTHGTAETLQIGTLTANYIRSQRNTSSAAASPGTGAIVLQPGDSLSATFSATQTTGVGITITVWVYPGCKFDFVSYYAGAAGTAVTTSLCTALRPRTLLAGAAFWNTAEATAGSLALDVTKDASATAPGAGTSMLASTVNLKGTALTYTQLALSATAANLALGSTDSVAVKISASSTELAGLCVTLAFDGKPGELWVNMNSFYSTVGTNEEFWISNGDYQLLDLAAKWSTASSTGKTALTKDTGTNTPSSGGVVLQTDNTNAGFDTSATANTPVFGTLAAGNTLFFASGDRAGLKNSGTIGSEAGFQLSMRLAIR